MVVLERPFCEVVWRYDSRFVLIILTWERKYQVCKRRRKVLPEGVLELSNGKKSLIRATITELNLEEITRQIKALFDNISKTVDTTEIKQK